MRLKNQIMGKRLASVLFVLFIAVVAYAQGGDALARSRINEYFDSYECPADIRKVSVKSCTFNHRNKTVTITLSDNFSRQQFRTAIVERIRDGVKKVLPDSFRSYRILVYSNNKEIESLIPNRYRPYIDQEMLWNGTRYTGTPWITNETKAFHVTRGLGGVHLSVTPSHGYYFDNREKQIWKWQRPALWCTREDLLSQSFVYPYLIPMLENAGAVVTAMRERDWQTDCVVTDDQSGRKSYQEQNSRGNRWKSVRTNGYSPRFGRIVNDSSATVRVVGSGSGRSSESASVTWSPEIPKSGNYSVYVTYHTFSNSVSDARYTVFHQGGETTFRVNQKIGGDTWVYLGTFRFEKGRSEKAMVVLDNNSSEEGLICADAVRFGGGIGNEERGGSLSGKARYLEGSRYYAKFSGAPDSVFLKYDGLDDYNEDIQTRPRMTNWLSGGSIFNPTESGANVPIELSFALHTDAGVRLGDSIVGSLGICTTQKKDGILATGLTRDVSRDLADQVLSELKRDIEAASGRPWTIRGVLDGNYCESREPQMPSTLLELLSHQNFYDLKYAFDPTFRFVTSRAIYKSILKYVSFMHGLQYTVQPLPVDHFMITENKENRSLTLSWQPVYDPIEPSARPDGYVVYTSIDGLAFDNGIAVRHPYYELVPEPGHVYSFKVTALNGGGQSMPSETLSACLNNRAKGTILVVNGFQRLSGPATVESSSRLGFDLEADAGVQYMSSPIFCGIQKVFDRSHVLMSEEEELGFSGDELDGTLLTGNTFNYPFIHGMSIAAGKEYSFVSCSREAVQDSLVMLKDYPLTDLILGLQKRTPNDTIMGNDFRTFPPILMQMVRDYCINGGRLLVSGSYVGSDLCSTAEGRRFASDILGFTWSGSIKSNSEKSVKGLGDEYSLVTEQGEEVYQLTHPDVIEPVSGAIAIFAYTDSRFCAGVGQNDRKKNTVTLGFPFESLRGEKIRTKVMSSLISYLMR